MSSSRRRRKSEPQAEPSHEEAEELLEADAEQAEETTSKILPLTRLAAWLPVVVCFLGFSRSPWVLGLAATAVGLLVLLHRPQAKVPAVLLVLLGGILVLTLLPLLPVPVPFPPAWRQHVSEDLGIALPLTWSAQPLVTLEKWLFMVVPMVWFLWLLTQEQITDQRSYVLRILAFGVSLLAAVSLVFYFIGWNPPGWITLGGANLGPFPNRNHISSLMAMNAILCLASAYDLLRRRKRQWVLYALGLVPCFAVVIINTSRAGLILFFVGVLSWFLAAALRKRSLKRLAIGGALLLACTTGTVLFGQHLLKRFSSAEKNVIEQLTTDSRFELHLNTLEMILQHPVLGVGLGNFDAVFGMTNQLKQAAVRFAHPESDLLWFAAEAGWPAAMAALAAVLLFLRWMGPWRVAAKSTRRRERRLRIAAGLAVILVLLHGLMDTPGHGMPMALLTALLSAMALYGSKLAQSRCVSIALPLRAGGLLLMAAGITWFLTGMGVRTPMGASLLERDLRHVRETSLSENVASAWTAVEHAVRVAPLNWEAWYYHGSVGLRMGRPHSEALADFGRARYLEPNVGQICLAEGNVWLSHNPQLAIPAWREALRRQPAEAANYFRAMLTEAQQLPELRPLVRQLATDARLTLLYLSLCPSEQEAREVLADLLTRFPNLEGLNHQERSHLFHLWRQRGDRKALVNALQSHPSWLDDGWLVLAFELADNGQPQKAYEIAMERITSPMTITLDGSYNLETLQREFLFNPSDAKRGFSLAVAQRERRMFVEALATLEKVAIQPNAPKHVNYEIAKVHAAMNNFVSAWESLAKYLQR